MTRREAKRWMQKNVSDHVDNLTGEVNMTSLAESCCDHFNENQIGGPLDQEDHFVWELASDIFPN